MTAMSRRSLLKAASGLAGVPFGAHALEGAGQTATAAPVITLTCADYVRFMPIATGDVKPDGMTLRWIRGDRNEMLRRATQDPAADGGESSLAQHVMRIAAGDRSLVAIPVFPLRNFTARDVYVAKGSKLTPQTLNGRRLGIYNWAASGAVWYRHLVRFFGQDPAKISWVVGAADSAAGASISSARCRHM